MKRISTAILTLCLSAPLLVSAAGCSADAAADRQDDGKTVQDAAVRDAGVRDAGTSKEKPKDKNKKKDGDKGKGSGTTGPEGSGSSSADAPPRGYR